MLYRLLSFAYITFDNEMPLAKLLMNKQLQLFYQFRAISQRIQEASRKMYLLYISTFTTSCKFITQYIYLHCFSPVSTSSDSMLPLSLKNDAILNSLLKQPLA